MRLHSFKGKIVQNNAEHCCSDSFPQTLESQQISFLILRNKKCSSSIGPEGPSFI